MAVSLALGQGARLVPPGGYPLRLTVDDYEAIGVVPKGIVSVSAEVAADHQADIHLALLYAPTTVGGADGEVVTDIDATSGTITTTYQADAIAASSTTQTITVTIPTTKAPAVYVVRLWADNFVGGDADTADRNGSGLISDEPQVPGGVTVSSVYVE